VLPGASSLKPHQQPRETYQPFQPEAMAGVRVDMWLNWLPVFRSVAAARKGLCIRSIEAKTYAPPSSRAGCPSPGPFLSVPCGAGRLPPAAGVLARLGVGSRWPGEAWAWYWKAAAGVDACKGALDCLYSPPMLGGYDAIM
jgi:hypothetical protein